MKLEKHIYVDVDYTLNPFSFGWEFIPDLSEIGLNIHDKHDGGFLGYFDRDHELFLHKKDSLSKEEIEQIYEDPEFFRGFDEEIRKSEKLAKLSAIERYLEKNCEGMKFYRYYPRDFANEFSIIASKKPQKDCERISEEKAIHLIYRILEEKDVHGSFTIE